MRTLVDPKNPIVQFHLTPYDLGVGEADINDFLHLLQYGSEDLKQKVLAYNGIVSINVEGANPFSRNTNLTMTFKTRDAMMRYLKGELGDKSQIDAIRPRLKEFFDEQDKIHGFQR